MTESESFAERIQERFPEGLTGVFAVGGTRTSYILTNNLKNVDPGRIEKMERYGDYGLGKIREIMQWFLEYGGRNIIVPVLSYQSFANERGAEYAEATTKIVFELTKDDWVEFYRLYDVDPYFAGIDTLLCQPEESSAAQLGKALRDFSEGWVYKEGRHKIIWEIAPIPLYSLWRANQVMGAEAQAQLQAALEKTNDLREMHQLTYSYYSQAAYGTNVPIPDFYLGTNRNGDMKLRAMLPISLLCGDDCRFYYTPYPSFFLTKEGLKAIIEDLAFGRRLRSKNIDYSGRLTPEFLEAEYQRIIQLSSDPSSTVGLVRSAGDDD